MTVDIYEISRSAANKFPRFLQEDLIQIGAAKLSQVELLGNGHAYSIAFRAMVDEARRSPGDPMRCYDRKSKSKVEISVTSDDSVLNGILAGGPSPAECAETCDLLEQIESLAGPEDWDLLSDFYGIGRPKVKIHDLAAKYGVTHTRIYQRLKEIYNALKSRLA